MFVEYVVSFDECKCLSWPGCRSESVFQLQRPLWLDLSILVCFLMISSVCIRIHWVWSADKCGTSDHFISSQSFNVSGFCHEFWVKNTNSPEEVFIISSLTYRHVQSRKTIIDKQHKHNNDAAAPALEPLEYTWLKHVQLISVLHTW